MEKKTRKTKKLNVELDNKSIENEAVNTPSHVELEANKEYTFVSNGTFHTLPKGSVWKMLGSKAQILINKGYGSLK
jgi:hypothetical protein